MTFISLCMFNVLRFSSWFFIASSQSVSDAFTIYLTFLYSYLNIPRNCFSSFIQITFLDSTN